MPTESSLFDLFYGAKNRAPTALGSLPAPPGEMVGDFRANLEGIPETVDRYSSPDAGEGGQFDDWQDNRGNDRFGGNGIRPTASLTNLNMGNENWGASGRFGLGIGANTINAGVNIDRTGVIFRDLMVNLGFGNNMSAEVGLLGRLDDPDRFEGAVNFPVGQGNVALTGGVPLNDYGEPNVGLTYSWPRTRE